MTTAPTPSHRLRRHRRCLAAVGALVLALGLAAATPASGPDRGPAAEAAGGHDLAAVARAAGLDEDVLRAQLRAGDGTSIDAGGRVVTQESHQPSPTAPGATRTRGTSGSITAPYATSSTFTLHTRPGATKVLYLDFTGHVTTGTPWNTAARPTITSIPFDLDGSPSTFSAAEHAVIQRTWQEVREDFAPFDVDVTTQDPGVEALRRSSAGDTAYGVRAVVSATNPVACSCVGLAYLGSFDWATDTPAWVIPDTTSAYLPLYAKYVGALVSHEVGHTLGLSHDGNPSTEYHTGNGTWAPIMGWAGNATRSQWSRGQYPGATNTEDDLAIPAAEGVRLVPDDVAAGTTTTATLPAGVTRQGVIGATADIDSYRFSLSETRRLTIRVANNVGAIDANLNARAILRTAAGSTIVTASPTDSTGASLTVTLAPGTYYLAVDGVGEGSTTAGGYSNYGSLGHYAVTLTWA